MTPPRKPDVPWYGSLPPSLLARNTVLVLLAQVAPLLVAIFAFPVLLDRFGIARFGVLSWAWLVLGYAAALDLGISRASTKAISELIGARAEDNLMTIASTALLLNLALGAIGGATLAAAAPALVGVVLRPPADITAEATDALLVVASGVPIVLALSAARSVLEGAQRFDLVSLVAVPSAVLTYLIPAIGASQGLSLLSVLLLIVAARLVGLVAYLLLWPWAFPTIRTFALPEWPVAISLLRFGGWLTLSSLASPAVLFGERAVVASTLTVRGLGLYVIPYELVARLSVIPGAFYSALFPAFSMLSKASPHLLAQTYARSLSYVLIVMAPPVVLLVSFSSDLLRLWLGSEIAESSSAPLQLFAVGALVNSLGYIPLAFLQGTGRPSIPAKVQIAEIVPAYLLTWALASSFGLIGAATAWLCRMIADSLLLFAFAATRSGGADISKLRRGIGGLLLVISAAGLGAASVSISPPAVRIGAVGMLLGLLLVLSWTSVMTPSDRAAVMRLRALVARLRRRAAP